MRRTFRIRFLPRYQKFVPRWRTMTTNQSDFCFHQLKKYSRSFDLVIRQLPDALKESVCVYYLILRALDTIEDSVKISPTIKKSLLGQFSGILNSQQGMYEEFSGMEEGVLNHLDQLVEVFSTMDDLTKDIIKNTCTRMADGMIHFSLDNKPIETISDYELYCHFVAGIVGEGLTKLFEAKNLQSKELSGASSMGIFLQMVNIIRDVSEDRQEGRDIWPQEVSSRYSDKNHISSHMVYIALLRVPEILNYLKDVEDKKVFMFCSIPQVMAIATLEKCFQNADIFEKNVKISKLETANMMLQVQQGGFEAVQQIFDEYANRIFQKIDPSEPLARELHNILFTFSKSIPKPKDNSHENSSDHSENKNSSSKNGKRVIIIGAGPGGMTSGMILSSKGFDVDIYERNSYIGGRNSNLKVGDSDFDLGPTILLLPQVIRQAFKDAGRNAHDYMEFKVVEPMYRVWYEDDDKHMDFYSTKFEKEMIQELERVFPNNVPMYQKYLKDARKLYDAVIPSLHKTYSSHLDVLDPTLLKALPYMKITKSMWSQLDFNEELLKLSFSFQSMYLGTSPRETPYFFSIIPYMEHAFGVFHVEGGLNKLNYGMAKVIEEEGGKIHLNTPVKQIILDENKNAIGVELADGRKEYADDIILNADFASAMEKLIPDAENVLQKWKPSKLAKKKFSSSTFMIYLDLDILYEDLPFHNLVFVGDFEENFQKIDNGLLPKNFSFYLRNSALHDKTVNPEGGSGLYFLVPVQNEITNVDTDWSNEETIQQLRDCILERAEKKLGLKNLQSHIKAEKIISPLDWKNEHEVYGGAVYNLAHIWSQLLSLRPRNEFNEISNLYIASGACSPGSGLPTIQEAGRMASSFICDKHSVPYERILFHAVPEQSEIWKSSSKK